MDFMYDRLSDSRSAQLLNIFDDWITHLAEWRHLQPVQQMPVCKAPVCKDCTMSVSLHQYLWMNTVLTTVAVNLLAGREFLTEQNDRPGVQRR